MKETTMKMHPMLFQPNSNPGDIRWWDARW